MSEPNLYKSPEASLTPASAEQSQYGSGRKALDGTYDFTIGGILSEAWDSLKGMKTNIIVGYIILVIVFIAFIAIATGIGTLLAFISPILTIILNIPAYIILIGLFISMYGGLVMIAIKHSVGLRTTPTEVTKVLAKALPLLGLMLLMNILVQIGYLFLIIPGLYLAVAYIMALPLMMEKYGSMGGYGAFT